MSLWLLLALIVPFMLAAVNMIDKLVVDRHISTTLLYPFYIGIVEIVLATTLLTTLLVTGLEDVDWRVIGGALVMGSLRGLGLATMVLALRLEQVSRVIAIWFLNPIMVVGMAVVFLSESVSGLAIGAIAMASLGAGVVSWTGGETSRGFMRPKVIVLALVSALAWATANILTKQFVDDDSFWQLYFGSRAGFGAVMLLLIFSSEVRRGARTGWRSRPLIGLFLLAEVIVTISLILYYTAINLGPVSLVSAIGAIQPLTVLIYSIVLALLFPAIFSGWVTRGRGKLVPQLVGTLVLAVGVSIVSVQ